MSRKKWTDGPSQARRGERPGRVETPTLANMGTKTSRRKRAQCRICLADGDLAGGVCRDCSACEQRQPPLEFP